MQRLFIILALALAPAAALATPLPSKPHIYVEGSAAVEAEPDEMRFSLMLEHTADTLGQAKAVVDQRSHTLIDLSRELGISDADIATTALRITPAYTYENNRQVQVGTTVSRQVDIHLRDLKKYPEVMKAMVEAEVSQTVSTELLVSNEDKLSDEALIKALENAQQRAKRLAEAQGRALGRAFSISEFMTRDDNRYSLQVSRGVVGESSAGMAKDAVARASSEPFEPGTMKARAQVFVVYLLK